MLHQRKRYNKHTVCPRSLVFMLQAEFTIKIGSKLLGQNFQYFGFVQYLSNLSGPDMPSYKGVFSLWDKAVASVATLMCHKTEVAEHNIRSGTLKETLKKSTQPLSNTRQPPTQSTKKSSSQIYRRRKKHSQRNQISTFKATRSGFARSLKS